MRGSSLTMALAAAIGLLIGAGGDCCAAPDGPPFPSVYARLKRSSDGLKLPLRGLAWNYEWGRLGQPPLMTAEASARFPIRAGESTAMAEPDRLRIVIHPSQELLKLCQPEVAAGPGQGLVFSEGQVFIFDCEEGRAVAASADGKARAFPCGDSAVWDVLSGTFRLKLDYRPYEDLIAWALGEGRGPSTIPAKPGLPRFVGWKTAGDVRYAVYDYPLSKKVYMGDNTDPERQDPRLFAATCRVHLEPKSGFVIRFQVLNRHQEIIAEEWGEQVAAVRPGLKGALKHTIIVRLQERRPGKPQRQEEQLEHQVIAGRVLPKEYRHTLNGDTFSMRFSAYRLNPELPPDHFILPPELPP